MKFLGRYNIVLFSHYCIVSCNLLLITVRNIYFLCILLHFDLKENVSNSVFIINYSDYVKLTELQGIHSLPMGENEVIVFSHMLNMVPLVQTYLDAVDSITVSYKEFSIVNDSGQIM